MTGTVIGLVLGVAFFSVRGRREGLLIDGRRVSVLDTTGFDLWGCLLLVRWLPVLSVS